MPFQSAGENKKSDRPLWKRILRVTLKVLAWLVALPFILIILIGILIYVPPVQNMIRGKSIGFLKEKTGANVSLDHFNLRFPLGLTLEGFHIDDLNGDTLVHAGALKADVSLSSLWRKRIVIGSVSLEGGRANISQDRDSVFNFDFLTTAFATPDTVAKELNVDTTATDDWTLIVQEIELEDLRVRLDLQPSQLALDLVIGEFETGFDEFSLDPMQMYLEDIELRGTRVHLRMASNSDPPEPDTYPYLENPMKDMDLRFERFLVEDLQFTMKDVVKQDSLWLALGQLDMATEQMQLKDQLLELDRILVDQLHFGMLTMASKDTTHVDTIRTDPPWLDQNDGFRYFVRDWNVMLNELRIANSSIAMHTNGITDPIGIFDPDHLVLNGIEMQLNEVALNNERIALQLEQLSAADRNGENTIKLALNIDATPARIEIGNGSIRIAEDRVELALLSEPGDLSNAYRAPNAIPLKLEVSSAIQLSRMAPMITQLGVDLPSQLIVEETWRTDLLVQGTIDELDTINIDLSGDQGTELHVNALLKNAQHWPSTDLLVDLEQFRMGGGIRRIMNNYVPSNIDPPQRMEMSGTAQIMNGRSRIDLQMESDAGSIEVKGNANGLTKKVPDNIDLALKIIDLRTHRFTGDTSIGTVSLDLLAKGEMLNSPQRTGNFSVDPHELSFNGIDLSDLEIAGKVQGDSMDLGLDLKSAEFAIGVNAKGTWPDDDDSLRFGLDLLVDRLRLEQLGLVKDPLGIDGRWIGEATFHTSGMGHFNLNGDGLRIFNDEHDLIFEKFAAFGFLRDDSTAFDLQSDALALTYRTNIHPDSLITGTRSRIAAIVEDDTSFVATPGKSMQLDVSLPRTEWLTEIVLPDLQEIQLDRFTGKYDSDTDEIDIDLSLPKLVYGTIVVEQLVVDVNAKDNALNGTISVQQIESDPLRLERLSINATTADGELRTLLRMEDVEGDRYRIGTVLRTIEEVREIRVNEDLILNSKPWTIHGENVLRFPDAGPVADHFILSSGDQRIEITTPPDHLIIDLTTLQLRTITDFISTVDSIPLVAGAISGSIELPRNDQALLGTDLSIADLHVMGSELGKLTLKADERSTDRYVADVHLQHEVNKLDANADADLSGDKPSLKASADLKFQDLGFLEPFVSDLLFSLGGGLEGELALEQHEDELGLDGALVFKNAKAGLILTGAEYTMPDERITFNSKGVHFDRFQLLDSAGNRFQLDGSLDPNAEEAPAFDLSLRTDRFQFVNSTIEDNENFFGDLFTALDLKIVGNTNDPKVTGLVSILDDTYLSIVLPGSSVEIISHEGIVVFTDDFASLDTVSFRSDGEILADSLKAQLPGIELDLDVKLSPDATIAVVLDPVTGDAATVSAEADLKFRYGHDRDMYLSGPLTIAGGGYTLNFHGLVKKEFELVKGGTITWSGDPAGARMDIKARYISNTAPYPLVANASSGLSEAESNRLRTRLPFEVLIEAGGRIDGPQIEFALDLPQMLRNSYPQVNERLEQLAQRSNEEEKNRQVFALLVLNSFIMDDPNASSGGSDLASTAARNSVNSILSDQLNKLTGKYIQGFDISLGVNTYDQSEGGQQYQRTSVDYQVSKRLLDDRLTFEVGGSIGVDEQETDVSSVNNTRKAQYAIMYDLTKDGRIRLRGFHENAFDLYDGEITRSGIAIMYSKEFEENAKARQQRREQLMRKNDDPILPVQDGEDEQ